VKAREYIARKIKQGYSPEQVSGVMRQECPDLAVSHETIYQHIYKDNLRLQEYLRRRRKMREKRGAAPGKHALKIPNRTMIAERPKEVEERKKYGHWEADTIISRANRVSIQVLYERKSMYLKLKKMPSRTAPCMRSGITRSLCKLPEGMRRTITFDNGPENAEHEKLDMVLKTRSYFCNPYHSWERGGVENVIGLVREYLPKQTNFDKIEARVIKRIERKLNNRPRKSLGYKTPKEVYRLAVALAA
jgi:IS30 family transposase